MSKKGKISIVIVDDHPIVRQGIAQLLEHEGDIVVEGTADDAQSGYQVILETRPDVAIVDISLKDSNGIELIKNTLASMPDQKILVLSLHDENVYAERVLKAGAKGFVMKDEDTNVLVKAVHDVYEGKMVMSSGIQEHMIQRALGKTQTDPNPLESLSDRELEVFQLTAEGKTTKEIAYQLSISTKTVETYKSHIKLKLGLHDSTELLQYALTWKLTN